MDVINTTLETLKSLIGSTTWDIYKNRVVDILSNTQTGDVSSNTIETVLHHRTGAIFMHNDLALSFFDSTKANLPTVTLPHNIPYMVVKRYFEVLRGLDLLLEEKDVDVAVLRTATSNILGNGVSSRQSGVENRVDDLISLLGNMGIREKMGDELTSMMKNIRI
jgi:hypothetical protein